jgi:hypothetical protein
MCKTENGCEMKRARCRPAKSRKQADKEDEDEFFEEDDKDPRPFWRRVNPEAGLPLWEAMLFYGDPITPEAAATRKLEGFDQPPFYPFEEMTREEQREYNAGSHQLERTSRDLQYEILEKLRAGKLFATGYASNARLDEPPARIFADLWRLLELDVWNSAAKGNGIEISGILIFKSKRRAASLVVHKRHSPAEFRRWYRDWVSCNLQKSYLPSRDEDLKAAQEKFGDKVHRPTLRALRKELAPDEWKVRGRRRQKD